MKKMSMGRENYEGSIIAVRSDTSRFSRTTIGIIASVVWAIGSQHRTSKPLGKVQAVCVCSFGELLSFGLRKPDGHDLALSCTLWQFWPSGFAFHPLTPLLFTVLQ